MPAAIHADVSPVHAGLKTQIALPGSKSFTNRALIIASVAKGESILRSPLFSDDSFWCTRALEKLGAGVTVDRPGEVIALRGADKFKMGGGEAPYIGSAGTIARFLPGIIAARGDGEVALAASAQLSGRPVAEMAQALEKLGAKISLPSSASFPMQIRGGSLKGGETSISGSVSSQFISGLLLAAPLAEKPVTIHVTDSIVQSDYIRMTLQMMEQFGVTVDHAEDLAEFRVKPQDYQARDIRLEADASTATYFFALAAVTKGQVTVTNLTPDTLQPDIAFVDYLEKLGCTVTREGGHITVTGPDVLKGGQVFDFNALSDSTPALAVVAPFADGPIEVRNVMHIRKHESDRLAVLRENLQRASVGADEFADGLRITPVKGAPRHAIIDPHDDHRIAMAFGIMGAGGRGVRVMNPACVSKTCPDFFDLLRKTGVDCTVVREE